MTLTHILFTSIVDKLIALFINSIVCEMHAHFLHIFFPCFFIIFSSKSTKALLINKDAKGIVTHYQNIDS